MANRLKFTEEEFDRMVEELMREKQCYNMLWTIAMRILPRAVSYYCWMDAYLRGLNYDEDVLHESYNNVRINVVTDCFGGDIDGIIHIQKTPAEFQSWIYHTAWNTMRGYSRKVKIETERRMGAIYNPELDNSEYHDPVDDIPDFTNDYARIENDEELARAVRIVLGADSAIHIKFAWLAHEAFSAEMIVRRDKVNGTVANYFGDKPLKEIYKMLLLVGDKHRWLNLDRNQRDQIEKALSEKDKNGRPKGEIKFGEFF